MFSGEVDLRRASLSNRIWGTFLGHIVLVGVAALIVTPRIAPALLGAMVLGCLAAAYAQRGFAERQPVLEPFTACLAVFLLYATLSTLWSARPLATLGKTGQAVAYASGAIFIARVLARQRRSDILHISEGLWIGLLVGVCYFSVEILSDLSMKRWLFDTFHLAEELASPRFLEWHDGKLSRISIAEMTRNATPFSLLVWPAAMGACGGLRRPWNGVIALSIFCGVATAVFLSPQETSKLAMLGGTAVFLISTLSRGMARRLLAAGWAFACLGVLPAVLAAFRFGLHTMEWLPWSGRHRIVLWNTVAEQALKAPLFGTGADMTGFSKLHTSAAPGFPNGIVHAHNVFLQTWFELGATGALLLCGLGLAALAAMRQVVSAAEPFAHALFASATIVAALSYGMWTPWYMATFAFCLALFPIGAATIARSNRIAEGLPHCEKRRSHPAGGALVAEK